MLEGKPRESLVLYDTPIEVGQYYLYVVINASLFRVLCRLLLGLTLTILSKRHMDVSICRFDHLFSNVSLFQIAPEKFNLELFSFCAATRRAGALPPMEAGSKPRSEDVLNAIIPPREWIQGGKHWIQKASPQPASRIDVARLREMLDQKLMERQARESGICPVREELFKQCFEEIIRQVTLNMPERGLLLLRVKRDIYSNIQAYHTLYNSSVTFAMRKQL